MRDPYNVYVEHVRYSTCIKYNKILRAFFDIKHIFRFLEISVNDYYNI